MKLIIDYEPLPVWEEFYYGKWDVAVLVGSRGSGKTWNVSNFSCVSTLANTNYRTLVLRDVGGSIKESIFKEIKDRFLDIQEEITDNYNRPEILEKIFDFQATQIVNKKTKETNVFSKGFRTSRVGQTSDLKGFADIDLVIMEEMEDVKDEERVNKLIDTLRKKGHKIIIILNTPNLEHWVVKRFFDSEFKNEIDGVRYYELKPKKIDRVCQVISTFKDNPFLPENVVKRYESYGIKGSYNYNLHHYYTDILAYATEAENLPRKFNLRYVLECEQKRLEPIEHFIITCKNNNTGDYKEVKAEVYHTPVKTNYVLSVDTSSGLGNDYTAIKVRYTDGQKYREFLKIKQKLTEDETVQVVLDIANRLNAVGRCLIIPEVNYGSYVTNTIRNNYNNDLIYKRYVQDPNKQLGTLIPDFGFKTTNANRDLIINNFVRDFENGLIEVNSLTELEEMKYFVYNDDNKRYEATIGQHDDELMADFICYEGFNYFKNYL